MSMLRYVRACEVLWCIVARVVISAQLFAAETCNKLLKIDLEHRDSIV